MRITTIASAAALLLLGGCTGHHAEPKSGVTKSGVTKTDVTKSDVPENSILASGFPVGGRMPMYRGTKVAGGDDGIKLGKSLCYT
jgi:hypothetical protein